MYDFNNIITINKGIVLNSIRAFNFIGKFFFVRIRQGFMGDVERRLFPYFENENDFSNFVNG